MIVLISAFPASLIPTLILYSAIRNRGETYRNTCTKTIRGLTAVLPVIHFSGLTHQPGSLPVFYGSP